MTVVIDESNNDGDELQTRWVANTTPNDRCFYDRKPPS